MIRQLRRSTDFERVLKSRSRVSSPHFALHHVAGLPAPHRRREASPDCMLPPELSTGVAAGGSPVVDGTPAIWLGMVVPKRHARRAVTRAMLKRQIRNVVGDGAGLPAQGLWIVRLRAPFDRSQFTSAASDALRRAARSELQQLLTTAADRSQNR